eukprot:7390212-Prymnesium_polylepis.4
MLSSVLLIADAIQRRENLYDGSEAVAWCPPTRSAEPELSACQQPQVATSIALWNNIYRAY